MAGGYPLHIMKRLAGYGARQAQMAISYTQPYDEHLNTPVEALEYAYPLRVLRYEIRRESGGIGKFRGAMEFERHPASHGCAGNIALRTKALSTLRIERRCVRDVRREYLIREMKK